MSAKEPLPNDALVRDKQKEDEEFKLQSFRKRQALLRHILDNVLGPFRKSHPAAWGQRAYLMLVGILYHQLAVTDDPFRTDDLAALAKMLSDSRRADAQSRRKSAGDESGESAECPPDAFAQMVRDLFGADLQLPEASNAPDAADQ